MTRVTTAARNGFIRALGALMTFALTASVSQAAFSMDRDPVGEVADYKIDRSTARTSAMIQSGTMRAAVTASLPDHPDGPSYQVQIDYTFRIRLVGTRSGTELVPVPQVYFTPEFMADLRANGSYVSDSFKVQHLGYADARTMDGGVYPHCDKIRIYDVQTNAAGGLAAIVRDLLGLDDIQSVSDIENLEIVGHIKEGLPVLGAAKIDVSGIYQGARIKAGADYERP